MNWFVENIWKDNVWGAVIAGIITAIIIAIGAYCFKKCHQRKSGVKASTENQGIQSNAPCVDETSKAIWYHRLLKRFDKPWKIISGVLGSILTISGIVVLFTPANYEISYHRNDNSGTINNAHYTKYSEDIILTPIERDGYLFSGWYEDACFAGDSVLCVPKGSKGNRDFWAKWVPIEYSIKYNTWGGIPAIKDTVYTIESEDVILPTKLTNNGYNFKGWTLGRSSVLVERIPKGSTDNKEFVALWEKVITPGTGRIAPHPQEIVELPQIIVVGYAKEKFSKQDAIDAAQYDAFRRLKQDYYPDVDISVLRLNATPVDTIATKPHPSSDTWDASFKLSIRRNL